MSQLSTEQARAEYNLGPDTKDWTVSAQKDVKSASRSGVRPTVCLYRPFDMRWTFYTGQARGFMCNPRKPVMANMVGGPNIALCITGRSIRNFDMSVSGEG